MRPVAGLTAALAVLIVAAAIWLGSASGAAGAARVVMDDTHFSPNRLVAKVGQPLQVELVNQGSERHDFAIPSIHMPGLQGFEASTEPGQTTTFTLQFDTPGTHEFVCPNPGGAADGMTGAIFVSP